MNTLLLCYLLAVHWWADFAQQTDEMATGKATSNRWLTIHVAIYTAWLMVGVLGVSFLTTPLRGLVFVLLNGALHWGTDYVTSRWTSRLWKEGRRHDFFVAIGADQLVHTVTLILTASWLLA